MLGPAPATGIFGVGAAVGIASTIGLGVVTMVVLTTVVPPPTVTVFLHESGVPVKTKLLSRTLQEAKKDPVVV